MNSPESVPALQRIDELESLDRTRGKGLHQCRLSEWVDHFCGVVGVEPCCFGCMYNFYMKKTLLGLGKVARGTRTYATRPFEEVSQYLEGVVRKSVRVAQLSQTYSTLVTCSWIGLLEEGKKPDRLGFRIRLITSVV